jgi:heme exporter protein B
MSLYRTLIARDIRLAFMKMAVVVGVIGFFVIAVSMFVFAVPQLELIPVMAPAIIWVCALLASLLALDTLYHNDYESGVLEQLFLQGTGVVHVILAKIISHWCITGLPILAASPLLLFMLGGQMEELRYLAVGTMVLSIITNLGAALTLGNSRSNIVMGIVILPLYIPTLIFGIHHNGVLLAAMVFLLLPVSVLASRCSLL